VGLLRRFSPTRKGRARDEEAFSLSDLTIDDAIELRDIDYKVVGKLIFKEESETWVEYFLESADSSVYLRVEELNGPILTLWKPIQVKLGTPLPEVIEYDGVEYEDFDQGEATVIHLGRSGPRNGPHCDYWEYEDEAGEAVVLVENWQETLVACEGDDVELSELRIVRAKALAD